MREQKVFAGQRVRQLRMARKLTQAAMARDMEVSASYLNLVENNQRPLTTQLLLKLAATYDLDMRELSGEQEAKLAGEMTEAMADPLFKSGVQAKQIADFTQTHPEIAQEFLRLYASHRKLQVIGPTIAPAAEQQHEGIRFPIEEVREIFLRNNNHCNELDQRAEELHDTLIAEGDLFDGLKKTLQDHHNVRVSVLPLHALPNTQRHYDRHNRRLFLSEMLPRASRVFQTAVQLAFLGHEDAIEREVAKAKASSDDAARLYRIGLGNYFAGAAIMPYTAFAQTTKEVRYDLDILSSRFDASLEQAAQRLTSLQKPGTKAIPFFLLRLDHAGNISKQFAAAGFPFPNYGSTCPRWQVHDAFATPGETKVQLVELPQGNKFLTIARTVESLRRQHGDDRRKLVIALGCDSSHASEIIYADGLDLENATPIGATCRICERENCTSRASPPMTRPLFIDTWRKGISAFEF